MLGFKVLDLKDDKPLFIFHGVNRTRTVPRNEWIEAERKFVTDGSCSTEYLSGFHIFPDHDAIKQWCKSVKNIDNRVVVKVDMRETRPKSHSKHDVILADHMYLSDKNWKNRVPLKKFAEATK